MVETLHLIEDAPPLLHDLPEQAPLPIPTKALYASGDLVDGVISYMVGAFAFYYLTAVCHLSGTLAGALLAISIAVDAVADPLIGFLSDNLHSRWGRRHPFMLLAALPTALGLGLLFSIPVGLSGPVQFLYVMVVLLTLRISMSAYTLPYGALGAEISTNYTERSTIVAWRSFFNIAGNLSVIILGPWLFLRGADGQLDLNGRAGYAPMAWSGAAIVLAGSLVSTLFTTRLLGRLPTIPRGQKVSLLQFLRELRDIFRNPSFLILFLCILAFWAAQGTISVLNLYVSKYFWRLPGDVISTLPFVSMFGLFTGIPLGGAILQKVEKRLVSIWGLVVMCFLQIAPPLMKIAHLMPADGWPLWITLGAVLVVSGWATTCVGISFISMLADAADEHELLFGSRREGLYFAGLTFSAKAAIGIGSLVAGVAIDLIHFLKDLSTFGENDLPADTVRNLGLIFGPGAGAIAMLSAIILIGYKLDVVRYREIQQELAARKAVKA